MRTIDIRGSRASSGLSMVRSKQALLASTAIGLAMLVSANANAAPTCAADPGAPVVVDSRSCTAVTTTPEVVVLKGTSISQFVLQGPSVIDTSATALSTGLFIQSSALLNVITLNSPTILNGASYGLGVSMSGSGGLTVTSNALVISGGTSGGSGIEIVTPGEVTLNVNEDVTSGGNGVIVRRTSGGPGGLVQIHVNGAKIDAGASGSAVGVVNTAGVSGSVLITGNAAAAIDPPAVGIATGNVINGNATVNWAGAIDAINKGVFVDSATGAQPNGNASVKVGGPITNSTNTAGFIGIHVEDVANNVEIESDEIISTGAGSIGVRVNNSGAITNLRQNDRISVDGDGIQTSGIAGSQLINSLANITSANGDAIDLAGLGKVNVNTLNGTTLTATGTGGRGIVVLTGGGADIDSSATLNTNAGGIIVTTQAGGAGGVIDIDSRGTITTAAGTGQGIFVSNAGGVTGGVNIKQSGAISNPQIGVGVLNVNGNVDIESTASINATLSGINTRETTGDVKILATKDITVTNAATVDAQAGIFSRGTTGKVTIETLLGSTIDTTAGGGQAGIAVTNLGGPVGVGDVNIRQGGVVKAASSGIVVDTRQGPVTIDSLNDVTATTGDSIFVTNVTGAVKVNTADGKTLTAGDDGIVVTNSGPATIKSRAKINATDDGIETSGINGAQEIETSDDINATNGDAIRAGGTGSVKILTALNKKLDAGDDGIRVTAASTVEIDSGSKIEATDDGIVTRGATSSQDIRVRDDITTVNGDGVDAEGAGSIVIQQFAGSQIVSGDDGIAANSTAGGVDITQDETIDAGGDGIVADAADGFANKVVSKKQIDADDDGVRAVDGAIDIETQALINAGGDGIVANSGDSAKIVQKAKVDADDDAIRVRDTAGNVDISAQQELVAGDDGIRVSHGVATGGNVVIVTNSAAKITAQDDGIEVTGTKGTTTVTVNAKIDAVDRGTRFANNTGNIVVNLNAEIDPTVGNEAINNAGDVTYNQNGFDVIATQDGYFIDQTGGKVDLNIDGAIKGPGAGGAGLTDGIDIDRTTGNVEIDTTAKGTILASGDGINVDRTTANVIINTGAAIGSAALPTTRAIVVDNTDGDNTLTLDGTINATSKGVLVRDTAANAVQTNNTTVTLKKSMTVTAGDGIDVDYTSQKSTGNTTVNTEAAAPISTLAGIGIRVNNSGDTAGDVVQINQAGTIAAQKGIVVTNTTGLADVNANNAITALGLGGASSAIQVTDTTGDVTVDTNNLGFLTSDGTGVEVRRTTNDATVTTNAQIDANSFGIVVDGTNRDAKVTQNGAIDSVAGAEATKGILVTNTGRDVTIDQNALINAQFSGIQVSDTIAGGNQTRNTAITTTAAMNVSNGDGIDVDFSTQNSSGNTTITTGGVITANLGKGIRVINSGDALGDTVLINQNQSVSAVDGIFIDDTFGTVDVNSNDPISATVDAIYVEDTTGNVFVDTDASATLTAGQDGVEVRNTTGNVNVTTAARIDATDRGIEIVTATGNVVVQQNGLIDSVAGAEAVVGIDVAGVNGTVGVTSNQLVTAQDDAIRVAGTGLTSTVTSNAQLLSRNADLVDAAGAGNVQANLNFDGGFSNAAGDWVVQASSTGGTSEVNIDRLVQGDAFPDRDGVGGVVRTNSLNGSTVNFFSNANALALNDVLVVATGGATAVNVSAGAVVEGQMTLTSNGDTVTNNGQWVAYGRWVPTNPSTSDFGAGADLLTNTGVIFAMNDGSTAETTNFVGLETFNSNNGTVWLSDEATGSRIAPSAAGVDVLNSVSSAYTGSGNARYAHDAFLGGAGSNADEVRLASTAGQTTIDLNDTNAGPGAYNPNGIVLVRTPAGGSQANHFVLGSYSGNGTQQADQSIDKGLFFYDLFFKPNTADAPSGVFVGNEDQHILAGLPDGEIFQLASIPLQMQNHFHAQAGDWLSRNVDLRDETVPAGQNWNFWAKAYGSWQDREQTQSFTFLNKSFAFDVSYDQNNAGMMAGFGYTDQLSGGGKLRTGLFAGYTEFDSEFVALRGSTAHTNVDADGYSLGAYVSYTKPSWYVDGFFKADFMNVDIRIPTLVDFPPAVAGPSATNYGAALEAGYQHKLAGNLDGLVFAGLTYVQSRIDNIELAGATVDYGSNSSLRGRLGVGIDTVVSEDKSSRVTGGLSLAVVHEFLGENDMRVFSAGPLLPVTDEFDETLAQVSARLEYNDLGEGLTAFLKGDYEFNGDYEDVRVSAGIKLPFQPPK